MPAVAEAVDRFVPWYSSVHRGAGYKSRRATDAYESARARRPGLRRPGARRRRRGHPVPQHDRGHQPAGLPAAPRRPTTWCVTTVVEHHANLLPWARVCRRRFVECGQRRHLRGRRRGAGAHAARGPRLLAITGASNVTGWLPPAGRSSPPPMTGASPSSSTPPSWHPPAAARRRRYRGLERPQDVRPVRRAGCSSGPGQRSPRATRSWPGAGAVDLVDLDEVGWTEPPEREEAGSPNVIGAVALEAAIDELGRIGWDTLEAHERRLAARLRRAGRDRRGAPARARPRHRRPCPSPPSWWTASPTPWWRPG